MFGQLLSKSQKKLTATQLLKDRYDMFIDSWEVSAEDVRRFRNKPDLFVGKNMDKDYLQKLTNQDALKSEDGVRNYLLIVQLYEYLAFAHALTFSTKYLGKGRIDKCWERFRHEHLDRWLIGKCWERSPNRINDNYFDPYGERWITRWVEILLEDPDFPEVHKSYKDDHPEFYRFVESVKERVEEKKDRTPDPDCN